MKKLYIILFVSILLSACWQQKIYTKENNIEDKKILLQNKENNKKSYINYSCITKIEKFIVNGSSMYPLLKHNQTVEVMLWYKNCNNLKKGDIVIYNYAWNKLPLIKQIKGEENDKFSLKKTDYAWNIIINDEVVKNSEWKPYAIPDGKEGMLKLYAKSYPIIPKNVYLILWDQVWWSMDSTIFWLISKTDIYWVVKK